MDLEHYAVDDDAAGDLLLQFMEKMSESTVKKPKLLHEQTIKEEETNYTGGEKCFVLFCFNFCFLRIFF